MNFKKIEKKWREKWEKKKAFVVKESLKKRKHYVLGMYPYPSGSGLHMGHAFMYTIPDVYARMKRMQGFNVLHPMGFDSFGLPAENAAIKARSHPKKFTENAIKNFIRQMKNLGLSCDWTRMVETHKPDYYKWDQWIFLKMLEKGLAYKKKASVNWCRKCSTVLANEQVIRGRCWRHDDTEAEIKHLEQWFFRITEYADELYEQIDDLRDWPEEIKRMQKNWIGKSPGVEIEFEIKNKNKVILVDAVDCLIDEKGNVNKELKKYLDSTENRKIILTNASLNRHAELFVNVKDYEIFTLENNPNKKDPNYYSIFLERCGLGSEQVIYFEHDAESVRSARSRGINTVIYNNLDEIKKFIEGNLVEKWPIFTTRPDTLFGVTFMVVSAQHPRLMELVIKGQKKEVETFLKKIRSTSEKDLGGLVKEGVFTGSYAVVPLSGEKVPIWTGNFVLAEYGSGMVMAVPAHDQRDYDFAKKYGIKIKEVVRGGDISKEAFTGEGELINSEGFNGLKTQEAREHIVNALHMKNLGKKTIQFKLRDWLISRQRFWGTPIPIIYCDDCGIVPVPVRDLPVKLPSNIRFARERNPLVEYDTFVNVKCPQCGGKAKRETDTMDTFVNSSWYFLRYCDSKNSKKIFERKKVDYWNPIDTYIGGREHATGHLIYFRFYTKFLKDIGMLDFSEPAKRLFNQGMLHGDDGMVMSKSKGNVVLPEEVSGKYGIDTVRLFLVSIASPDKDIEWSDNGIDGSLRFVKKVIDYVKNVKKGKSSKKVEHKINRAIKGITNDIENFRYNLAVIKLKGLFDSFEEEISKKDLKSFLKMFSVFCPHIGEELWEKINGKKFVSLEKWPSIDESKIDEKIDQIESAVEKTTSDIQNILKIIRGKRCKSERVYIYVIPNEIEFYDGKELSERVGKKVVVSSVNDKNKHDPDGKSKKAKPGKPAIFVE